MPFLDPQRLQTYRNRTFRLSPDLRLRNQEEAVEFVNERGFIYFWPIKGVICPSLWAAVAGDRPIPAEHDDPGHITWSWKDDLLDKRRWYYAKVLRGKATLISLATAPFFYALSQNYGDPEHDYLEQYAAGQLTLAAKNIYECLLHGGPLDTVTLRRTIHMTSRESDAAFGRALTDLQRDFKVLPVGIAQTGAWRYSFIYDLVHRYYPDLPEAARAIPQRAARRKLVELYLVSVGAITAAETARLFGWRIEETTRTLENLVAAGEACGDVQIGDSRERHFVTSRLFGGCQ